MSTSTPTRQILRIHVALAEIEPPIWRELEVAADLTFVQLHWALQRAFGWEGYHLFSFEVGDVAYGEDPEGELGFASPDRAIGEAVERPGQRFVYVYDFGDDWRHAIEVRAIETKPGRDATCLAGARACPPEDCGGVYGYQELLRILADPSDPDHADTMMWNSDVDPEAFDLAAVDLALTDPLGAPGFVDDPVEELLDLLCEEILPDAVVEEIVARREEFVSPLLEVLLDPDLIDEDGPGAGWAPIHAATLLCEMKAEEAVEPLLDILEETNWDHIVHDRIILKLPLLGAAVVEPALARLDDANDDTRTALLAILSRCKVEDARIYAHLVDQLDVDHDGASADLADYGDPAALPLLVERFDAVEDTEANDLSLVGLAEDIELLGKLTKAQRQRVARARERIAEKRRPPRIEPVRRVKIGRNDPCPCGSGKKYKKCHLSADRANAR